MRLWGGFYVYNLALTHQRYSLQGNIFVLFGKNCKVEVPKRKVMILALALFVPGILVAIVVYGIAGHVNGLRADLAQSQLIAVNY